jgi:hypothetical protein
VTIEPFRLLPGDDASCLNLYAPRHPRILGARASFIGQGRFAFQQSLAARRCRAGESLAAARSRSG